MTRAWRSAPRGRWIVVAGTVVAALVIAELASGGGSEEAGRAAPPLPTKALRPPGTDLAQLRGKPALVDFFASWCAPCAEEAPTLRKLSAALGDRATVVAVDWDDAGGPARAFVRKHGWTFPVLADTSGTAGESYGLVGLPTSFVLDPQGRIVATFRGPQSEATLRQALLEAS
ncbi:MAG TPA: TlpA disulfide reductase family protein [Solirubrobacterales bacterium]|nr:TlpA disulfide reductase family protein [Solirubrobacterales bacterium]